MTKFSEGIGLLYFTLIILILVFGAIRTLLGKIFMIALRFILRKCLRGKYQKIARFVEPAPEEEI